MFDPYHIWLGIPPKDQPPHHYRLLGIELFESHADVIDAAATRQSAYLQSVSTGAHRAESQRLLTEIAAARRCLLNPDRKAAYDADLRKASDAVAEVDEAPAFPTFTEPGAAPKEAVAPAAASRARRTPRANGDSKTARTKAAIPWSTLVAALFVVILFLVWWNMRDGEEDANSRTLDADQQADLIEQEQATDPGRSFFTD